MALKIRLRRMGRKKAPTYRIVVAESTMPRDGRFVANLGHYNPRTQPMTLVVDREKALEWMAKGAQPTDTVKSLLRKALQQPAAEETVAQKVTGAAKKAAATVAAAAETVVEAAETVVEAAQAAVGAAPEEAPTAEAEPAAEAPAEAEPAAEAAAPAEAEKPAE